MLGPIGVVLVLIAKFFAKLKFAIIPLLKFLPLLLKSGGTMLLMIWVYTQLWDGSSRSDSLFCCSSTSAATWSWQRSLD